MVKTIKIAIFISGPKRFTPLVIQRMRSIASEFNPEFFVHLWTDESGPKARTGFSFDENKLLEEPDVRCLILHRPYSGDAYKDSLGSHTNSGSPIFATMGMFLGINQLCYILGTLPNQDEYTHVLRIRSDCALLDPQMFNNVDFASDHLYFSFNPFIPKEWLSDHLCLAKREHFLRFWQFSDIHQIYDFYVKARRNPEKMLSLLKAERFSSKTKVINFFYRFRDYQIIYTSPKENEPDWVNKAIIARQYRDIFLEPEKLFRSEEIEKYYQGLRQDAPDPLSGMRYFKRIVLRYLKFAKK